MQGNANSVHGLDQQVISGANFLKDTSVRRYKRII
jgi:hypothetical protein